MTVTGIAMRAGRRAVPASLSSAPTSARCLVPRRAAMASTTVTTQRLLSTTSKALSASPARDRTREIVKQTISSIGSKREGQQWMKLFSETQNFAVIKVGGAVLTDYMDDLCRSLLFLTELGLVPCIVHGSGPQINDYLEAAGVEPQFEQGIRVTDSKTLGIVRRLLLQEGQKLADRLDELGVPNRSIGGAFLADYLDKDTWQNVGKITKVNKAPIESSIKAGYVPILTSMAETEDGQLLNVNADVAAAELARSLQPMKIVYLAEKGGLFDGEGNKISTINLDAEYAGLMEQPWVRYGLRLKIVESKELLDTLPRSSSVAIIHPRDLQKELFTDSGAGTLIRRGTSVQKVTSVSDFPDIDKVKEALIRDREGLDAEATVDRFIDYLKENPFTAYYDDEMQCLAIIMPAGEQRSIPTLATLNITKSAWLSNLAENVFAAVKADNESLVWTVSQDDENLSWFWEKASGSFSHNGNVLFFYGCDFDSEAMAPVYKDFKSHGRAMMGDSNLESRLRRAAQSASESLKSHNAQ